MTISQFYQPGPGPNAIAGTKPACDTKLASSNTIDRTGTVEST